LGPAVFCANWPERTKELGKKALEFCALAKRLLFEEKIAAGMRTLSKTGKVNERVDPLRRSLFGKRMNHGGFCGALFDLIDRMLLDLIRGGGGTAADISTLREVSRLEFDPVGGEKDSFRTKNPDGN
jgi:hypothetical protein